MQILHCFGQKSLKILRDNFGKGEDFLQKKLSNYNKNVHKTPYHHEISTNLQTRMKISTILHSFRKIGEFSMYKYSSLVLADVFMLIGQNTILIYAVLFKFI